MSISHEREAVLQCESQLQVVGQNSRYSQQFLTDIRSLDLSIAALDRRLGGFSPEGTRAFIWSICVTLKAILLFWTWPTVGRRAGGMR